MSDIKFADGLRVSKPHENAPDFVKGRISIKRETLIDWLNKQQGTYINLDIKESKSGNLYAAVDNWKPKNKKSDDPDIPF
jgi:hypothetical protein